MSTYRLLLKVVPQSSAEMAASELVGTDGHFAFRETLLAELNEAVRKAFIDSKGGPDHPNVTGYELPLSRIDSVAVSSVMAALDRILQFGRKVPSFLKLEKDSQDYWECLLQIKAFLPSKVAAEAFDFLKADIPRVRTGLGKARAFLLNALNNSDLQTYLSVLCWNQDASETFYGKYSVIRHEDSNSMLLMMLDSLATLEFQVPLNDERLDDPDVFKRVLAEQYARAIKKQVEVEAELNKQRKAEDDSPIISVNKEIAKVSNPVQLLKDLKEAVAQIEEELSAGARKIYGSQPVAAKLCGALEECFSYGLQEGYFFGSSLWDAFQSLEQSSPLDESLFRNAKSYSVLNSTRAHAFIQLCLNQGSLLTVVSLLRADLALLSSFYNSNAIVRDPLLSKSFMEVLCDLQAIPFSFEVNQEAETQDWSAAVVSNDALLVKRKRKGKEKKREHRHYPTLEPPSSYDTQQCDTILNPNADPRPDLEKTCNSDQALQQEVKENASASTPSPSSSHQPPTDSSSQNVTTKEEEDAKSSLGTPDSPYFPTKFGNEDIHRKPASADGDSSTSAECVPAEAALPPSEVSETFKTAASDASTSPHSYHLRSVPSGPFVNAPETTSVVASVSHQEPPKLSQDPLKLPLSPSLETSASGLQLEENANIYDPTVADVYPAHQQMTQEEMNSHPQSAEGAVEKAANISDKVIEVQPAFTVCMPICCFMLIVAILCSYYELWLEFLLYSLCVYV